MDKGSYYNHLNTIIEALRNDNSGRPIDLDSLHNNDNQFEQAIKYIVKLGIISKTQNSNYLITTEGYKFLVDYSSFSTYDDEQSEIKSLQKDNLILQNKSFSMKRKVILGLLSAAGGSIATAIVNYYLGNNCP